MTKVVDCSEHGQAPESFVCGHILESLWDGQARGFYYSSLNAEDEPCAWCADCERMLHAEGDVWTEELEERAGIKLLCYECFLRAARLNGVLH